MANIYIYIKNQKTWEIPSLGFEKNRFHIKNTFFKENGTIFLRVIACKKISEKKKSH